MGSRTCSYMLRVIRQLQPQCYSAGIPCKFTRTYKKEARHPFLSYTDRSLPFALRSTSVPTWRLCHETPKCFEDREMASDDIDEQLNNSPTIPFNPVNENIYYKPLELPGSHIRSTTLIALDNCTTPMEVMNVFSSPPYSKEEVFQGVMKLWNTFLRLNQKQKYTERQRIVDHPNFNNLSQEVQKIAPGLLPLALVRMLYVFVRLKVDQQTKLMQNLLLKCQEQLSSLKTTELLIVARILENLKSDAIVEKLKYGLCLLIDVKIEDVNDLMPLLALSFEATTPLSHKLNAEKKVLKMIDKFSIEQIVKIFCILADNKFYSEPLLKALSCKLIDGIDDLPFPNIVSVLSCCCELQFRNESLLAAFGDQIMKTIFLWKPWQLALILRYQTHLRFRHIPLLDRYADIFANNLKFIKMWDLSQAITIYSTVNHLPEKNSERFLDAVHSSLKTHLDSIPPKKLLFIVYDLCQLGACPDFVANKLLQYESIFSYKDISALANIKLFFKLNEPHSSSLLLQSIKKVPAPLPEHRPECHLYIENCIGNPDLFLYNLLIANTFYIDFILALDTQEKKLVPVADLNLENLQEDHSSGNIVRIAVLCCTPNAFTLGTLHPRGNLALKSRFIKSFGFSVAVVPVHKFVVMTEEERMEFLRSIIFQCLPEGENVLEDKETNEDLHHNPQDS